ncbi:MAG TPA: tRNA pseudouridine(38-40) synthase TruA [Flavobacteriia bacterium]|nr:tRNA pseudouridine(38-40) synthase TruA [Flavobacteriia bacterium]
MRYFIELQYLGTNYHGWQVQPDAITVQAVIQKSLSTLLRKNIAIVGAGRTDAGVHASQMFAHFDYNLPLDTLKLKDRLNAYLPKDISILSIIEVSKNAHARFDAISRSYEYRIYLGKNPFYLETSWQLYHLELDINAMNEAAKILLQHTNFKCFSKSNTDVYTYNCDIVEAKWILENNFLTFHITANRFLRNMVRAIVGTLYNIGIGKMIKNDLHNILKSEDRSKAGFSVPAKGLFLTKVRYPFLS